MPLDKGPMAKTATVPRKKRPTVPATKARLRPPPAGSGGYHHGALHEALLVAAERILERDGLPGLTLRAAAREAGVSHAAPTHHFGDLTGLLSELAAVGFRRFAAALKEAVAGAGGFRAMGRAYVVFARAHPGLFTLMFRSERLDLSRPALREAMHASGEALVRAVGAERHETITRTAATLPQVADSVRSWAMVHGFAVLLLDGRLRNFLNVMPAGGDEMTLLDAVLSIQGPPGS
jgi:AcrR family transcriptional regulator